MGRLTNPPRISTCRSILNGSRRELLGAGEMAREAVGDAEISLRISREAAIARRLPEEQGFARLANAAPQVSLLDQTDAIPQ